MKKDLIMSQQTIDDFLMFSDLCDDNLEMMASCLVEVGDYHECRALVLRHIEAMRHRKLNKCINRVLDVKHKTLQSWKDSYIAREMWNSVMEE